MKKYILEFSFVLIVILLSITGFWKTYFGDENPNAYHHLHAIVNLFWLFLLLYQLILIGKNRYSEHRKIGLAVLIVGPLLVASATLLSVHSAHKGLVSGEGDALIVQNVGVTLETALFLTLAFIFKRNRKLHASFLLSTTILFLGIALFFTLLSFVSQYKIEGPETFYRFAEAATMGSLICLIVGLIFLIKAFKTGWPLLLAASFLVLNGLLHQVLAENNLIQPLTETIGSLSEPLAFIVSFFVLLMILLSTGIYKMKWTKSAI